MRLALIVAASVAVVSIVIVIVNVVGSDGDVVESGERSGGNFTLTTEPSDAASVALEEVAPRVPAAGDDRAEVLGDGEPVRATSEEGLSEGEELRAQLSALFKEALGEEPPDLSALNPLLEDLAGEVEIDPASIERDPETEFTTARISLPGTDIAGQVTVEGENALVALMMGADDPEGIFAARQLTVGLRLDGVSAASGSSTLQHHPDTRRGANELIAPGEVLTCGWSYTIRDGDTRLAPVGARADGNTWMVGGVHSDDQTRLLEGAYDLRPYDVWAAKVGEALLPD